MKRLSFSFLIILCLVVNSQLLSAQTWESVGSAISAGSTENSTIVFNGSTPYVAYRDNSVSNKATVKRYNGTAWETVGTVGFSAGGAGYITMAFASSTPYVAYLDEGNGSKATVKKFDGTNWVDVGSPGFSVGLAEFTSIAFDGTTPYVAYKDGGNGNVATVMKFDGTNWVNVGTPGFSTNEIQIISLVFSAGTPYVVYRDVDSGDKATVMKFNGTNWETVGGAGFSAGTVNYTSLAFHGTVPYVVYKDGANSNKATVMKFNGTSWELVGTAGFSAGTTDFNTIVFNGNTPYVTYRDGANGNKATVMKFNGSAWELVGVAGFTASAADYTSTRSDGVDKLYVVYNSGGQAFASRIAIPPNTYLPVSGFGNALEFDGTNDYVAVPDNITLRPTSGITIEAWIYTSSLGSHRFIIGKETAIPQVRHYLFSVDPTRHLGSYLSFTSGQWDYHDAPSAQIPANTWTHVAMTYDNSVMRFYMNGAQVDQIVINKQLATTGTAPVTLGSRGDDFYFDGKLDELQVWGRALTAQEIATSMYRNNTTTGLAGYWKFNESTGNFIADSSPNANNGTMTNMDDADHVVSTLSDISINEDAAAFTGTLPASEMNGNALTYSIVSNGTKGTAVITNASTDAFSYTPTANANGSDSFTYRVNNGTTNSNTSTINVAIAAVNDDVPVLTSTTAAGVTTTTAGLGGNITFGGDAAVTDRGIVWGTSANPTLSDNKVTNGSGTGTFSATINPPFSGGTTYHYRAYATNSIGTGYGSDISFVTIPTAPATPTASAITATGFTLNWTAVTGAVSYKLDVSLLNNFSSFVSGYNDLTVSGTSQAVSGLSAGTVYYFRIRAVNTSGTGSNSTTGNQSTLSTDATLSALALSSVTLSPAFTSGTIAYTASVNSTVSSITVTPTRTEGTATIKVNNTTVGSGSASGTINLNVGSNTITTIVTAGDGTTTKTYTVTVTRDVAAPVITSFTPSNGPVNTEIAISGTGFNTTASDNIVFFGATKATVTASTANSLTVKVPAGATHAAITVLNAGTNRVAYSQKLFLPTYSPNTGNIIGEDLTDKVEYTTGAGTAGVAIGDIDGDGKPDLAVTSFTIGNIYIFRNTGSSGSISFADPIIIPSVYPYSIAIEDIDGDGKQDIAVTSAGGPTISVFRNTASSGTISFASKVDFVSGDNPRSIIIRDLDGDGRPDLAEVNGGRSTISVFHNTGSPGSISFDAKADYAVGTGPEAIVSGDFDQDGKADLAVTNQTSNTISALRNTSTIGSINFALKVDYSTASAPEKIITGDFDSDGKLDLAATSYTSGNISVLRNTSTTGAISFAANLNFAGAAQSGAIATADVDGDGKSDLIAGGSNQVAMLRNTGSSGNIVFAAAVFKQAGSVSTASLAIGDLDADGKPDVAVANNSDSKVSIFRNKSGALPTITSFTPTNAGPGAIVTITGTNFSGITGVSFGGTPSTSFTLISGSTTLVTAFVGSGASGDITLTTPNGTATKGGFTFLNARLSALTLSAGSLSPVFSSGTIDYTATAANSVTSINLTPTSDQAGSTIQVKGVVVASGSPSGNITLIPGLNTIPVKVTASDGITNRTYNIEVTRTKSADADVSSLAASVSFSPAFAPAVTAYTASVSFAVTSMTLSALISENSATLKLNGASIANGNLTNPIPLSIGLNTITVSVTAGNGTTVKNYTITVTRNDKSTNANLADLFLNTGPLLPAFSASSPSYTTFVSNVVTSIRVTPRKDNAAAAITVNNNAVTSGSASGNIALTRGENTITIIVTAEDGSIKTYIIKVTRLDPDQVIADSGGNVTVSSNFSEVFITSPTLPITVTVPAGIVGKPTIDYGDLITGGTGTIPQTTINSPLAKVEIPATTTVTSSNTWDGVISSPSISDYTFPAVKGQKITKGLVIEVGQP